MATDERLRLVIDARNNASGTLRQIKGDLDGLDGAAELLGGGLSGLFAGLGVASVAGLGMAAVQLGALGASALEMREAFDGLAASAGLSGRAILGAMRAASEGMVADTELIAGANRALMMGAADSAQEFAALMEVAKVRSDAVGMSVGEAFSALAEGIGKVSERGLYALGIQMDLEKVNNDYAASLGKTAAALTESEKRQAMYNAVIAGSAEMVASASGLSDADKIDKAAAAWANLKMEIATALSPVVAESAAFIADSMERMREGNRVGGAAFGLSDAQMLEIYADKLQDLNDKLANSIPLTAAEMEQRRAWTAVLKENAVAVGDLSGMAERLKDDQYALLPAVNALSGGFRRQAEEINAIQDSLRGMQGSIRSALAGMAVDLGTARAWKESEELNESLRTRTAIMEQYGISAERIEFENTAWKNEQIGLLQDEITAQNALTRAAAGTATAVSELSDEYNDLKGRVSSVLQSALGDVAGVNVEDFLPREDAVAENARRLADIMVNGLKGQDWLGEFAAEVPDVWALIASSSAPKTMAASLLKDFQDGLRPDLLDKGRAKELVRAAIIGEQNMAALADEIAAELSAEMGVSMEKAKAAVAGTLGARAGARESLEGASTGLDGEAEGVRFATGFTAQVAGLPAQMRVAGASAGDEWRAGMETGIDGVGAAFELLQTSMYASGQGSGAQWGRGFSEGVIDGTDLTALTALTDSMRALGESAGGQWSGGFSAAAAVAIPPLSFTGSDGAQAGETFADDFAAAIGPLTGQMYGAGALAGEQWGVGFVAGLGATSDATALAAEIGQGLADNLTVSIVEAHAVAADILAGTPLVSGGQIAAGMDGAGEGDLFMDALAGAIKGRAAELFASGQEVGAQWGAGFMAVVESGVPPSLIGLLATLVTPAVMAAFATNNGQRGANP